MFDIGNFIYFILYSVKYFAGRCDKIEVYYMV